MSVTKTQLILLSDDQIARIKNFVLNAVPGATFVEAMGTEIIFTLPRKQTETLRLFFKGFDDNLARLGVTTYGVSDTTLEEIFLKTAKGQNMDELKQEHKGNLLVNPDNLCCIILDK